MKYLVFENKYFKRKSNNQIYFKDWCLPDGISYEKINKLNDKKYFDYKFSNSSQLIKNNQFVFKFIKKIFPQIIKNMNAYHGVKFDEKYWRIILYPWLQAFISFMHERWHMINSIQNQKKFVFCIYKINDTKFIIDSYRDFGDMAFQKLFNYWTLSKIVRFKKKAKFIEKKIQKTESYQREKAKISNSDNYKKKFYIFIFTLFFKIFKIKFFLKNLGISKYKFILLNLKLKQFPFVWFSPKFYEERVNLKKRKHFFYNETSKKNFDNFINQIFYLCIPKNYLENYNNIRNSINRSYWPKNVNAMLSAYDFKFDDVYKIWSAERSLNKKTKYLIIQHGGNSGLAESTPGTDLDSLLADKYLTWGWKGKFKNNIPFHSFLLSNQSLKLEKNKKKIFFCISIRPTFTYRYESLPRTNVEKIKKSSLIFNIINNIKKNYTKDIVLRYLEAAEKRHFIKVNKKIVNKKISFDNASLPFSQVLPKAKIVIHDTNNTGFLECLFFNVPTILVLDKKMERFNKQSKKYFNLMLKKKIIHYDYKSAVNFLNNNLPNIEKWWHDKSLQIIRKKFCDIYIKKSNHSLQDLKKLLEKVTK